MFMQHKCIGDILRDSIENHPATLHEFADSIKHLNIEVRGKMQKLIFANTQIVSQEKTESFTSSTASATFAERPDLETNTTSTVQMATCLLSLQLRKPVVADEAEDVAVEEAVVGAAERRCSLLTCAESSLGRDQKSSLQMTKLSSSELLLKLRQSVRRRFKKSSRITNSSTTKCLPTLVCESTKKR